MCDTRKSEISSAVQSMPTIRARVPTAPRTTTASGSSSELRIVIIRVFSVINADTIL